MANNENSVELDALVQRATSEFFESPPIKFGKWILVISFGVLFGGVYYGGVEVKSIFDDAKVVKIAIATAQESVGAVLDGVGQIEMDANTKIGAAVKVVTAKQVLATRAIELAKNEILALLDGTDLKGLVEARDELKSLVENLTNQTLEVVKLKEKVNEFDKLADESLAFQQLSTQVAGLAKATEKRFAEIRKPAALGLAFREYALWSVGVAILLATVSGVVGGLLAFLLQRNSHKPV